LIEGPSAPITYSKKAKPTASPLRPRTSWRNEQRRSRCYELPPLDSILIAGWGRRDAEYHVSMVVALTAGSNAASQMRRVTQDGYGSKAPFPVPAGHFRSTLN